MILPTLSDVGVVHYNWTYIAFELFFNKDPLYHILTNHWKDKLNSISQRIPFLDAARCFGALLGIILHISLGYLQLPIPQWPQHSAQSSPFFDYLTCAIHAFRLPIFFFLAGFFAHQLLNQSGYIKFIVNRFKRIVVPFFILGIAVNLPIFLYALLTHKISSFGAGITMFNLRYVWFLEYLIILYSLHLMSSVILKFFAADKLNNLALKILQSRWHALPIILCCFFALYYSNAWYTPVLLGLMPDIGLLIMYGSYFLLGILLSKHREVWHQLLTVNIYHLLFVLVIFIGYTQLAFSSAHSEINRIFAIFLYSILSYNLVIFFMALCRRFFSHEHRLIRFISDASYWIYLSQVFFILLVHKYIIQSFTSIFTQFFLMMLLTLSLSLISYAIFFRRNPVQPKTKSYSSSDT